MPDGSRVARGPVEMVEGYDALVRSDSGAILHVAKPTYEVVQNDTLWDVLDALVAEPDVKYETAGVLREGRTVWAMARVEGEWAVKGDSPIVPFVTVVNWHDGTGAFRAMRNGVRIVCQNTLNLAMRSSAAQYSFRHSANVLDRIEQAKAVLQGTRQEVERFVELGNELLTMPVAEAGRRRFLEEFIPSPPEALVTDRALANITAARQAVRSILDGDTGTVTPAQGVTAYGLFEAGVEYLDHIRPARDAASRFNRAMIEPGAEKGHVLDLAKEAARVDA